MYATILQSMTPVGIRQTAVVPINDKVRVFTRLGITRGSAGAWKEATPDYGPLEQVVGQPTSIAITPSDYALLPHPVTPTTLLQKLVRTTVGVVNVEPDMAVDQFTTVYEQASSNPMSLMAYTKQMSRATTIAPAIQVVHQPPQPVMVSVHTPQGVTLEELTPAVPVTQEVIHTTHTESEAPMPTLDTHVVPPSHNADAVLTVPIAEPYFERTFDGIKETQIYDYARSTQQNVLLTGDAGTGKTSSARNYASKNNLPFVTIECTQQIDQGITQGRFVPTGVGNSTQWKYSQLATAIQRPSVVLINELTRMTPKAASLFLRLLQERELLIEPMNEIIKVHPDVLFVADQNTGIGYTGTSKQDAALVDRFNVKLEFKYDSDIESKFIKSPALLQFATDIRTASDLNDEFSVPMSSRILQNFQAQATSLSFQFAVNSMLNNYPKSDGEREAIKMRFDAVHEAIAQELSVELGKYSGK